MFNQLRFEDKCYLKHLINFLINKECKSLNIKIDNIFSTILSKLSKFNNLHFDISDITNFEKLYQLYY